MEEKKKPHIPAWKVWVLIITAVQAFGAVQNFQAHQQLRNWILQYHSSVNQVITNDAQIRGR